jgi:acyl-[acyl-carrier protein] desaturase
MPRSDRFRADIYGMFVEFFEKAEKNRRWNIFSDIPWEKHDASKNEEEIALLAETFLGVEMYLPDYVSNGIAMVRETFGQCYFSANWAHEELKHALALREYLVRSGQRTPEEMLAYEKAILSREWKPPFETARQMTFYASIQEQATFMMYKHQLERSRERGDVVLDTIYGFIAKDEAAHADFYRRVTELELIEDRKGTIDDMALVFRRFKMPAHDLVPDYERRTAKMRQDNGIDRGVFLKEVWFPTLKKLGVTRAEITQASTQQRRSDVKDAA